MEKLKVLELFDGLQIKVSDNKRDERGRFSNE